MTRADYRRALWWIPIDGEALLREAERRRLVIDGESRDVLIFYRGVTPRELDALRAAWKLQYDAR